MSHSNSTQYYNLPQFDSTDKPAWLTDVNPAYASIDAGIHAAKGAADDAQADATQALTDASAAGTAASGADAKASGSIASMADTFDTTATYNVGDLVIYNNLLYICIVAVTVPGAWTGSGNWNRTTLEAEINKKQNTLSAGDGIAIESDEIAIDTSDITTNGSYVLKATRSSGSTSLDWDDAGIKTIPHTITKNSGLWNITESTLKRVGNVVTLYIKFAGAGSVGSGVISFHGNLNIGRPIFNGVSNTKCKGASPIVSTINSDGNIYVRNASPSSLDIGTDNYDICLIYMAE